MNRRAMGGIVAALGLGGGALVVSSCGGDESPPERGERAEIGHVHGPTGEQSEAGAEERLRARADLVKEAAAEHGILNPLVLAGIGYHESGGLKQCWSEATWACKGPSSPDCDGGPVIAASANGVCQHGDQGDGAVGMLMVRGGADDALTARGNARLGVAAMLDRLWEGRREALGWKAREDMIGWLNEAVPGTPSYDEFLSAMAELYNPCAGDGCPDRDYVKAAYDAATRDLLATLGLDYWSAAAKPLAGGNCTCPYGAYHNGVAIPPSETYCGMRVCGGGNAVYECKSGGWAQVPGLSCGYGNCSCSGGKDYLNRNISPSNTECHYRACGMDTQFYVCGASGWVSTGMSCPNSGTGGNPTCQCANGIDQNGNPIPPSSTYCGYQTCGVNNELWQCSDHGWIKVANSCGGGGGTAKFGFPLGDKSTSPAGGNGWSVWQVLGHYWSAYAGVHLAQDVGKSNGAFEPVYAIGNGVVRVSAPNSSTYKNVVLIEHDMGNGTKVCSFYAHLDTRTVSKNQTVTRGQQIATVMQQYSNTHLHYVIVDKPTCDHVASLNGGGMCGYDGGGPSNVGHADLVNEPYQYIAVGTNPQNGCNIAGRKFISPSKFINNNHF